MTTARLASLPLIPTTVVGSHPQPGWLVDRRFLKSQGPPRTRAQELWRVPPDHLEEAQNDATRVAVAEMERCGIDVVTDGEVRRESYSNHFATQLGGVDPHRAGTAISRAGTHVDVPLVTGPITWKEPVNERDAVFLRSLTDGPIKITVPGPFTMSQQAQDEFYGDKRALALAYAAAVNQELHALVETGVDIVQLDEPYLQGFAADARVYAVEAINAALEGVRATGVTTAVHTCYGYGFMVREKRGGYQFIDELAECEVDQIAVETAQPRLDPAMLEPLARKTVIVGVIDLGSLEVESADDVARRIRAVLDYVDPQRLVVSPDCGMKYLPRGVALAKLQSMVAGAALVRAELAGGR